MDDSKMRPWKEGEDALLTAYVAQEGERSWMSVSEKMGLNRNGFSCWKRWTTYLKPKLNAGVKGTEKEVKSQNLCSVLHSTPAQVAIHYNTSTEFTRSKGFNVSVIVPPAGPLQKSAKSNSGSRHTDLPSSIGNLGHLQSAKSASTYMQTQLPSSTGALGMDDSNISPWNGEEDALLAAYVAQEGECNWMSVSQKMGLDRTGFSCWNRWTTYLKPKLTPAVKGTEKEMTSQNMCSVLHSTPAQNDSRLSGKKRARDNCPSTEFIRSNGFGVPVIVPPVGLIQKSAMSNSGYWQTQLPSSIGDLGNSQSAKNTSRYLRTELPSSTGALAIGSPREAVIQSENVLNSSSRELPSLQRKSALSEQMSHPSVQDSRDIQLVPTGAEIFDGSSLSGEIDWELYFILEGLTSGGPYPNFWYP